MKKKLIIAISCLLVVCLAAAVIAFRLPPRPYKIVGEYNGPAWLADFQGEPYQVGLNEIDKPAFVDPKAALKQAETDFADGFQLIAEQCDLSSPGYSNYSLYKTYGAQIQTDDPELREECVKVSQFFDIYENSYPPQ